MASQAYKWLFIGELPLMFEQRHVARQVEIEIWLDSSSLVKALNLARATPARNMDAKYIA